MIEFDYTNSTKVLNHVWKAESIDAMVCLSAGPSAVSNLIKALDLLAHALDLLVDALESLVELLLELRLTILVFGLFFPVFIVIFLVLLLFLPDLLINLPHHGLLSLSLAHRAVNVALECQHWLSDDVVVVLKGVLAHLLLELELFVQERLQVALAKTVGVHRHQGLVCVLSWALKEILVAANDRLGAQAYVEVSLMPVLESHSVDTGVVQVAYLACVSAYNVDLLINLIALLKDVLSLSVGTWLERLQKFDHEVAVLLIGPVVVLDQASLVLEMHRLLEDEMHLEQCEEVLKEEVFENVALNAYRQLGHQGKVIIGRDSLVLVVLPVVSEVALEPFDHLGRQRLVVVEVFQNEEPAVKCDTVFVVTGYLLQLNEDLNELAHDPREAGNANQQDESHNCALNLALRVEVTKTDS